MRIKSFILAGLTVGILVWVGSSQSRAEELSCGPAGTWSEFRARVGNVFPEAEAHDITGDAKTRIVAYYNATPPATAYEPDRVRYLTRPSTPIALIVLEKGGCVVATAQIPVGLLRNLLTARTNGVEI